jgi:hypothetical protein
VDPAVGLQEEVSARRSSLKFEWPAAEDVAWLSIVPLTVLGLVAVFWLAPPLSHLYPGPSQPVFPEWRFLIKPEPLEDTRFLIVAAGPPILAALVLAFGANRTGRRKLDWAVIAIQLAGIAVLAWSVAHQIHVPALTRPDYFDPLLLSVPNVIAGVLIGILLTVLIASPVGFSSSRVRGIAGWISGRAWLAIAIAIAFTAIWLLPAVFTDSTVGQAGTASHSGHIPAQAEDYFAVVNGRTPLVDYIPLYVHLLPFLVAPVLTAFNLSLTSFSISMCILSLVGLMAMYGTFSAVTRHSWAALALYLPFVAISLFPWDRQGAAWDYDGNYYGFFPGRYLGPFVVAWLCALCLRGRRMPGWLVFFAAGLAVANNAEFGLPCLVAAVVALAFGADRSISSRERASKLAVHGAAGIGAALVLTCGVIVARSGQLPNPAFATYWSSTFAKDGYGLERMPTLGLHWAMYGTYAAALVTAAVRYVRVEPDRTLTGMLAFAGIFGILSGSYFAGRSVPWQLMLLFPVWGFALALLTWTVVRSLRAARADSFRLRRLMLPAVATLAGFGIMVAAIDRFPPPWQQLDRLTAGGEAVNDQPDAQSFVDTHTAPGAHVLLLGTPLDHRIAERAGVVNESPVFDVFALLSALEVDRAINFLEDDGGRLVFERVSRELPEVAQILRQRGFHRLRKDPASGLVEWRRE